FKIKNATTGYYVNATLDSTGNYTYTRSDVTATGATFALATNGKFNIKNLPVGTYTLIETATATGYTKSADKTFVVSNNNTTNTSVANTQDKGNLTITKKINVDGEIKPVTDFVYTTSDGRTLTWDNLKTVIRFKIKASNGEFVTARRLGDSGSGNFEYTGTSEDGSELYLSYDSSINGAVTVGTLKLANLPTGNYTIVEVEREGYSFKSFGVTASANISAKITRNTTTAKTVINKTTSLGDLTINKAISLSDNAEPTAEMYAAVSFKLKNSTGSYITLNTVNAETGTYTYAGTVTAESNATEIKLGTDTLTSTIKSLPLGDYTVIENVDDKFEAQSNNLGATVTNADETTVTFYNLEKTGTINVQKRTKGDLNLEGIGFTLSGTSDSGRAISKYGTTDASGELSFENIPIGRYTITEDGDTVPTAYLVAEPQSVDVIYNQTTDVTFDNVEKYGEILVQKRTEGDLNVEGIGFTLSGTSDSGREISVYGTTDETGKVSFTVPIGTYTITENGDTVPTAYLVAEPQSVAVVYNQTTDVTFNNVEKYGEILVQKRTEGDFNIANIGFTLSGTSDSGREISVYGTTDETG
ncbi:MAG: SpaA isopeptide-forming pilin-related protein, partial [Ruminococcus sp.]